MIRVGDLCIQMTWTDEPDQWRDYEKITTRPAEDQAEYLNGTSKGQGPRPGIDPVFRVGPAIKDHPEW